MGIAQNIIDNLSELGQAIAWRRQTIDCIHDCRLQAVQLQMFQQAIAIFIKRIRE